jgi:hypothetical protein
MLIVNLAARFHSNCGGSALYFSVVDEIAEPYSEGSDNDQQRTDAKSEEPLPAYTSFGMSLRMHRFAKYRTKRRTALMPGQTYQNMVRQA